ncbi:MAG TPA: HipA domain-containing protein [Opitutaceae bacterium]|nr:HipA domain-containing protein [Opitutaceae bacterium]
MSLFAAKNSRDRNPETLLRCTFRGYSADTRGACRIETFGEYKTLVVDRFDRRLANGGKWWLRLPQEDFCQVTGTPSALKYENDGGPGIRKIMDLLLGSERAAEDRRDFIRTRLVFWLLAAIDGHAKNFSIFLLPGGAFRLTPRYDILSAYPMIGHGRGRLSPQKITMAMAVEGKNRHHHWNGIRLRHWLETAKRCGVPQMETIVRDILEQTPLVLDGVRDMIAGKFPEAIASSVLDGVKTAATQLRQEFAASLLS